MIVWGGERGKRIRGGWKVNMAMTVWEERQRLFTDVMERIEEEGRKSYVFLDSLESPQICLCDVV